MTSDSSQFSETSPRAAALTKSLFLLFRETPRHAWYKLYHPANWPEPTPFEKHTQHAGYEVEALAKPWLEQRQIPSIINPSGTPGTWHWQHTFEDQPYHIRTDAWWEDPKSNHVHLFEIKSSTRVKSESLIDLAFQVSVIEATRPVGSIWLVHLDRDYVRGGELSPDRMFKVVDVTSEVRDRMPSVIQQREAALGLLTDPNPMNFEGCWHPKSCPCPHLCHPDLPKYPVTDFPGRREILDDLEKLNIRSLTEVPPTVALDTKQRRMVQAAQSGIPVVDETAIHRFLSQVTYPISFLDYEAYGASLPLFDGCHPQQHIVFQYSLHVIQSPETALANAQDVQHFEHVSFGPGDPSLHVMNHLSQHLPPTGSVMVWNASFEGGRNREMAEGMAEHKDLLLSMNQRMVDLSDIFRLGMYVDREFHGSWSIKNVLPVLVPELSYKDLPLNKGDQALLAWWDVVSGKITNPQQIQQLTYDLLRYCELDTWAMVRVWQVLMSQIEAKNDL